MDDICRFGQEPAVKDQGRGAAERGDFMKGRWGRAGGEAEVDYNLVRELQLLKSPGLSVVSLARGVTGAE